MDLKKLNKQLIVALIILCAITSLFTWKYVYPISLIGLAIFVHQSVMFVVKLGKRLPIREMIGILSALQTLVTPFLDYHIYPNLTFYGMTTEETVYMNYAVLANLFLIFGLQYFKWNKKVYNDRLLKSIGINLKSNPNFGLGLILLGFLSGLSLNFVPESIRFIFLLFSYLKYVGALYLIFSGAKLNKFWFNVIITSLLISSIIGGMFIDLFIWGIFFIILLSFKYKLSLYKNISLLLFIFIFALSIQAIKGTYRSVVWKYDVSNPIGLFYSMLTEVVYNPSLLISREVIDYQITRLNQGWIIAKIMNTVPTVTPYGEGETIYNAVIASIFPRFVIKTKAGAGDRYLFQQYTGHTLSSSTTMNLGLLGEAYANFGMLFGAVLVGLFGLLINFVIHKIEYFSEKFPTIILWLPFILTYPIRPGNDIAVLLNYLVKALIITVVFFYFFRKILILKVEKVTNPY